MYKYNFPAELTCAVDGVDAPHLYKQKAQQERQFHLHPQQTGGKYLQLGGTAQVVCWGRDTVVTQKGEVLPSSVEHLFFFSFFFLIRL